MSHWGVLDWGLLLAYGSLLLELTVFPVPSEASTWQLLSSDGGDAAPGDVLARARRRTTVSKLVSYLLPTAFGVGCFLLPLVVVFVPAIAAWLFLVDSVAVGQRAWVALCIIASGRGLTFVSVLQVRRREGRGGLQPSGLFSWSRNPGLVGMYVFYAGLCVAIPSGVLFIGFAPYLWNMHRRVLMEESHLSRTIGPAYDAYRERVPRYVGWR